MVSTYIYDSIHRPLISCNLSNLFNYQFRPRSLPDLTHEEYQIDFDPNFEKRNVKYKRMLKEIQWNDADYDSELNDLGISSGKSMQFSLFL